MLLAGYISLNSSISHKYFSSLESNFPDWDLVILGDGEERKDLSSLSTTLGLQNRIYLPGSVGNVSDWYERADLFVLSSSVEGFPNVLLEAMTYGLPCVSFDCDTGPRDMISSGVNGVLVDPKKDKEFGMIKALTKLLTDKDFRYKLSANSILLRDKYSVKNIMRQWDRILSL